MLQSGVKAVIFDVFGTLVRIGDKRHPYRQLQALMLRHGRAPRPEDATRMMTLDTGLAGLTKAFGVTIPAHELADIEADLYQELPTIGLYPETLSTLASLREAGLKLAICSNLAAPYAIAPKLLLPPMDAYAWSFALGAVKPDARLYRYLCEELQCDPAEALFVGDTPAADFDGPRSFGMQACLIDRNGSRSVRPSIENLSDILPMLFRPS